MRASRRCVSTTVCVNCSPPIGISPDSPRYECATRSCECVSTARKATSTTGQILYTAPGAWQFTGTSTNYSKSGSTGTVTGTGTLSWWNSTLNSGKGGWASVGSTIPVTLTPTATSPVSAGTIAITFTYTPKSGQPALPATTPNTLTSGAINLG